MTVTIPAEGFYVLKADVRNPKPDRRKKDTASKPTWKAGERVYVTPQTDTYRAQIEFRDGSRVFYDLEAEEVMAITYPWSVQGNAIIAAMEPAQPSVGQALKRAWATPKQILARAVDLGKLTLDDIKAIDAELADWSENLVLQFDEAHEI